MKLNIFKKNTEGKRPPEKPVAVTKEVVSAGARMIQDKGSASVYQHIISPYLTEKTSILNADGQYAFKVSKKSNKIEIKKAIEQLYGVHVEKIRIIIIPGKRRQLGRFEGEKKGFKKAMVRLRQGEKIETAAH